MHKNNFIIPLKSRYECLPEQETVIERRSKKYGRKHICINKGTFPGLRLFLATQNSFKMMKIVFYFTLRALLVPKIFKFLS